MRRLLLLGLLLVVLPLGDALVDACGSKFLVGARSARYQKLQTSLHPTSILSYWQDDPTTEEDDPASWDGVRKAIEKVGHQFELTTDARALESAIRAAKRTEARSRPRRVSGLRSPQSA